MSVWILIRLLVYGTLLFALIRGMRLAVAVLPLGPTRRRTIQQALPLSELLLGFLFVLAAVREIFDGWAEAVGLLGAVFGALYLVRFALMDVLTGVLLRTSGHVGLGDRVRVEDLEGRVTRLGTRALTLETRGGDEAQIPYSVLSRRSIVRTPVTRGSHRYTFRLQGEAAAEPDRIRRLALLSHWSAVGRSPVVEVGPDGACEVTVFSVAPDRGPDIEAFVRGSLAAEGGLGTARSQGARARELTPPVS